MGLIIPEGNALTLTRSPGTPPHDCRDISPAASGRYWVATDSGLAGYAKGAWKFHSLAVSELPSNEISGLLTDGPDLWIALSAGLARVTGGQWKIYTSADSGAPIKGIRSMVKDSIGNVWFATAAGLIRFDGTGWTKITNAQIYGTQTTSGPAVIAFDRKGGLWIGGNGLTYYDGMKFTTYTTFNSNLPSNNVTGLALDDSNRVWAGTEIGLIELDPATLTTTAYTSTTSTLPYDRVNGILSDGNGGVWIGTSAGIIRFNGHDWSDYYYGANSPMKSADVHAMMLDHAGALWFTTNDGLYRFDDGKWGRWNSANSELPQLEITALAEYVDGAIWMGTRNSGIAVYDAAITTAVPSPAPPVDPEKGDAENILNLY